MRFLLLLVALALLPNCQTLKSSMYKAEQVAQEHFDADCTITFNSAQTFALIIEKQEAISPVAAFSYAIYCAEKEQIVFEEQKRGGSVEWANDNHVLVLSAPEVQSLDREQNKKMSRYYINVVTLEKVYKLD